MSISSIFGTSEARLMKVMDAETGEVLKTGEGDNAKEIGILYNSKECEACKVVRTRFMRKWAGKKKAPSAGVLDRHNIDILVAAGAGFENMVDDSGPVEFSKDKLRSYLEKSPSLREQSEDFLEPENFLAKGSSSD